MPPLARAVDNVVAPRFLRHRTAFETRIESHQQWSINGVVTDDQRNRDPRSITDIHKGCHRSIAHLDQRLDAWRIVDRSPFPLNVDQ